MPAHPPYTIDITQNGGHGTIVYREGAYAATLYWEFCASKVVAFIDLAKDAPEYPGDRSVLLARVADHVITTRAPRCHAVIDESAGAIKIMEPDAEPTRR